MAVGEMHNLFRNLRRALHLPEPAALTDGQLLEQYLAGHTDTAFTALMERHGPMVLGVCRRILQDAHEAEDAYQATFLVFVRKAGSIVPREMVGNWLYGVAYRTALHARSDNARRQKKEREAGAMPRPETADDAAWKELRPLLDGELQCLPDRYRATVVLCDLEGKSRTEAAQQLGVPEGTLSSRLARAREMLARRLTRRGLTLTAGALATAFVPASATASVPAPLFAATAKAAALFAADQAVAGVVSAPVVALTEGVLRTMYLAKLKFAAALLFAVGLVITGAGVATHYALADKPVPAAPVAAADKKPAPDAARPGEKKAPTPGNEISGPVVEVGADGKSITLETASKTKGEDAKQTTFTLTDKTEVVYFGVGPDGAKPTKGYQATIRVQDGAPQTAARVVFNHKNPGKEGDIAGTIVAVADGGKSFTVETAPMTKGEPALRLPVKIGPLTSVTYFGVAPGGAKPTEGYFVQVTKSTDPQSDSAAGVRFSSGKKDGIKGAAVINPDVQGTIVAVADGGKRITVEVQSKVKGEPATRTDIQLTPRTEALYSGVGPDGTKPAVGQTVQIWIEGGTKDTAIRAFFTAGGKDKGPDVQGKITEVKEGGRRVTVEAPAKEKGAEPRKIDIAIADQTHVGYYGVGPDGARPKVGYILQAWLGAEGKDVAAEVRLSDPEKQKGFDGKKGDNPKVPDGDKKPDNPKGDKPKPADADKKPDNPKNPKGDAPKPNPVDKPKPDGDKKPDNPKGDKPKPPDPDKKPDNPKGDKPKQPDGDKPKGDPKKGDKGDLPFDDAARAVPGPARDPLATVAAIDREINRRLSEAGIPASARADDAEFLRRVSLDLTGRIPTLERARTFLGSTDPDKRRKLIDLLLASPDFGRHFADVWSLRLAPPDSSVNKGGPDRFTPWLAEQFNHDRGWDRIVTELLTVEGDNQPPSAFILANEVSLQPMPNQLAASVGRLFLGVQIQCAECHNHPFTSWKQADFWGMAAFFGRTRSGGKNEPRGLTERPDPNPVPVKDGGVERPEVRSDGSIVIPATGGNKGAGKVVPAKFLDGAPLTLDEQPLRPRFAAWLTSPENRYFARAFVNRTWAQLLGRGFVQPVDNMHDDNPPSHPALLALLADEFRSSGCDIKHLLRCICNSQAYQRTSKPLPGNEEDKELFSRVAVKVMEPEAFFDSLGLVLDVNKYLKPPTQTGGTLKGPTPRPPRDEFIHFFRGPDDAAEAGELSHGPPHFLRRMNSELFNGSSPLIERLIAAGASRNQVLESLYLATLSRRPTAEETRLMETYLSKRANAEQGYAGVLWILLNSGEFVLNH